MAADGGVGPRLPEMIDEHGEARAQPHGARRGTNDPVTVHRERMGYDLPVRAMRLAPNRGDAADGLYVWTTDMETP